MSYLSKEEIKDNIKRLREIIYDTCIKCRRFIDEVKIIGVTKGKPSWMIETAYECGIKDIGENYVQELIKKQNELKNSNLDIKWHFIGRLQSNKVKYVLRGIELIHSIDSFKILDEFKKYERVLSGKRVPILIEINIGEEKNKGGILQSDVDKFIEYALKLDIFDIRGLMTIPPLLPKESVRPYFASLYKLLINTKDKFPELGQSFRELSMGMSSDFDVAIEEGSTIIRIGTFIFGER